jgi:hypothetical protein
MELKYLVNEENHIDMNLAIYMVEPYIAQVNDGRYDELG